MSNDFARRLLKGTAFDNSTTYRMLEQLARLEKNTTPEEREQRAARVMRRILTPYDTDDNPTGKALANAFRASEKNRP